MKATRSGRKRQAFVIPPSVARNFRIAGNLAKAEEWRAKVLMGNSGSVKVGAWDEVGYVMISVDSPSIIPIARSDEHHCGYEVLREVYFRKKLVPEEKHVAIFAFGSHYVWDESVEDQREAFRRYGGANSIVRGMNERRRYIANIDDFISGNGGLAVPEGELSPVGKFVVGKLEGIARGVVGKQKDAFDMAYDFVEWLSENLFALRGVLVHADGTFEGWQKETLQAEAQMDYERLSRLFFSANGIKNNFHNRIRMVAREKNGSIFDLADVRDFWGDLNAALAEFDRLGQI